MEKAFLICKFLDKIFISFCRNINSCIPGHANLCWYIYWFTYTDTIIQWTKGIGIDIMWAFVFNDPNMTGYRYAYWFPILGSSYKFALETDQLSIITLKGNRLEIYLLKEISLLISWSFWVENISSGYFSMRKNPCNSCY